MVSVAGSKCGVVRAFCLAGIVFYGGVVCGVCCDFGVGVLEVEEDDGGRNYPKKSNKITKKQKKQMT